MAAIGYRRELAILFGSVGLFFLSLSMLIPTLPLYVRDLGGTPTEVGLVIGLFSVGVLVVRPLVGRAVDTRGRRPVLIVGAVVAGLVAPLYAFWTSLLGLITVRIVHGAGLSAFTSGSTTLVTDLAPPDRRTAFLSYFSTASILAFAAGPVLGIELAARYGYPVLFSTIAAFALASAGLGMLLEKCPRADNDDGPIDYRSAILRRQVVVPTVTLLLITLAHGGAFAFLPILLERKVPFNIGVFFLLYAGGSLLVRLGAGALSRRVGDGPMVWGGLLIYALGLAALPLVSNWSTLIVAAGLTGVGFGVYQPAAYGLVANATTRATRGIVFSVFLGAFDLGISLGGLTAGPVVAAAGAEVLMYGLALVPLAAAVLFLVTLGWNPDPDAGPRPCERATP